MKWLEDCGIADRSGAAFRLLALVVVAVVLIAAPAQAADPPVPPGTDYLRTVDAQFDFGINPLPADFFGPGSAPFTGAVQLEGNPFDQEHLGNTDTLIERLNGVVPPPFPAEATIDIEIVELSLTSVAPIEVNEGTGSSFWDVSVELDPDTPAPAGILEATKTHPDGGTFTTLFNVQPRLTFTRVGAPWDIRVFDRDDNGLPPIQLQSAADADWSYFPPVDPELIPPPALGNEFFLLGDHFLVSPEFGLVLTQAEGPPIPEPTGLGLIGAALIVMRRRRK